jgi:hypothetical protein
MEVSCQLHALAVLTSGKKSFVPVRKLGGPQSLFGYGGEEKKILPCPSTNQFPIVQSIGK